MEKLKLKQLAPYVSYGLKVKTISDEIEIITGIDFVDKISISTIQDNAWAGVSGYKLTQIIQY